MQVPLVFVFSSAAQTVSAMLPHPFLRRWQVNHPLMLSRPVTHFNEQSILDQILPVKVLGVVTTLNRPRCLYPREGKRASTIRKLIHGLFIGDVLLEGNSDSIERPRRSHKFASVASSSCAWSHSSLALAAKTNTMGRTVSCFLISICVSLSHAILSGPQGQVGRQSPICGSSRNLETWGLLGYPVGKFEILASHTYRGIPVLNAIALPTVIIIRGE